MSPITAEARDRILRYLHDHTVPNEPSPPTPGLIERMLDHLIGAVRQERPEDRAF